MRKILAAAMALIMTLSPAVFAETDSGTLIRAAEDLFFHTSNVTVACEATFMYDGEIFKTLHGSYKQDGTNSHLVWMLDTPKADGTIYTGGYTVTGLGPIAYVNETYFGNYYYPVSIRTNDTLFVMDKQTEKSIAAAGTVLAAAEDLFHAIEIEDVEGEAGKVSVKVGDLPDVADSVLWYLAGDYLWEKYGVYLWNENTGSTGDVDLRYEDYDALVNDRYRALYGTDVPDTLDDATYGRYMVAANAVSQLVSEIVRQYEDGGVYILKDGSFEWFPDREGLMRRAGEIYFSYEDYSKALRLYYEKVYGEPLTEDMLSIIVYSPNEELGLAFGELSEAMEAEYREEARKADPNVVQINVALDGTFTTQSKLFYNSSDTVTNKITRTTDQAAVKDVDVKVGRDAEGRITLAEGLATFTLTDVKGVDHTLEVSFSFTAGDYGTTEVPDVYDPSAYGFVTYDEYMESLGQTQEAVQEFDWEKFVNEAPDTIEVMGKTYETRIKDYLN